MYIAKQFSIFMVNKPGVLAKVLGEFAEAKINITAMTMMDSVEHGVMRVVFAAPEKAKRVLKTLSMPFNEAEVLCGFVRTLNLPAVRMCLDLRKAAEEGLDLAGLVADHSDLVANVHVAGAGTRGRPAGLEVGEVDWAGAVRALVAAGYRGSPVTPCPSSVANAADDHGRQQCDGPDSQWFSHSVIPPL